MQSFDRTLGKAAEQYVEKTYSADVPSEISTEAKKKIEQIIREVPMQNRKTNVSRRVKALLICAAVISLSVLVCAASPQILEYINMTFLREDSTQRLTEVPEGYIGIYTAEDLDNVRNDLHANYILMNDIVITEADYAEGGIFENGFEPIGEETRPYRGIFNGNGYVIAGLHITADIAEVQNSHTFSIGLFGAVQRKSSDGTVYVVTETIVTEADKGMDVNGDGDFDDVISRSRSSEASEEKGEAYMTGGIIKNLGLTDGSLTVYKNTDTPFRIGAIAGAADFIAGCYTEDFPVTLINNTASADFCLGGIAGKAEYVDSCWTDAVIRYELNLPEGEIYKSGNTFEPGIGGIVGQTYACVTSYFDGELETDATEYRDWIYSGRLEDGEEPEYFMTSIPADRIANLADGAVPAIMTDSIMEKLSETLSDWNLKKVRSFYMQGDYRELDIASSQYTTDNTDTVFYILDPDCKPREIRELSLMIRQGFTDISFEDFCRENNIKYGIYSCYDLRTMPECSFDGFDFDYIWHRSGDEKPVLRLFEGGSLQIEKFNIGDRPRFGWQKGIG